MREEIQRTKSELIKKVAASGKKGSGSGKPPKKEPRYSCHEEHSELIEGGN